VEEGPLNDEERRQGLLYSGEGKMSRDPVSPFIFSLKDRHGQLLRSKEKTLGI
jgi:hypothetical protein